MSDSSITSKQWTEVGLPFELWLRYTQAGTEVQQEVERHFHARYGGNHETQDT